ncbi:MAG TPA: hypothetical protein VK939_13690 [Longimicrobiales bacterium]|nr:hypothetical protein [Longimicrobiales bacterium]
MSFFRSIVLLLSVVLFIAFAYFAGHGLAVHSVSAILTGFVFLALGAVLVYAQLRVGRARR